MRGAALWCFVAVSLLTRAAAADCSAPSGCIDAEPLWLSPSAVRFATISDTAVPAALGLHGAATLGFRLRPAVLTVPSPSRDGRDVNLLRHATDLSLGLRLGLGNRLEVTALVPAGLYQRGAGIKGITDQAAPAIAVAGLHDPRLGFGFQLVDHPSFGAKLRFEAKLPLGDREALTGESTPVASPALALAGRRGNWFGGAELGLRLRKPSELFGLRVGSQALLALGVGYELPGPGLRFSAEAYALPSLVDAGERRYLPAEWLASVGWAPHFLESWAFGAAGGGGLPLSSDPAGASFAFGVPAFRALLYARVASN